MKRLMVLMVAGVAGVAMASEERGLYGDTPDAKHAWCVHDLNRAYPVQITTKDGVAPSDAKILFDGTQASVDANWRDKNGKPTKWTVKDGSFICTPKSGSACTREAFGDAQFHVEWMCSEENARSEGYLAGNSGVFPMGMYEVQILNSYYPTADCDKNYPDGITGSVYAENPPLVNACRPAGTWQSYDIIFHQPIWENGKVKHPGTITVFLNGVLVQDAWELEGCTTHCRKRPLVEHATRLPWSLQDHSCPVLFRNIWIREIPSRWANTTHSIMSGVTEDVMALREKTAASLFAKVDTEKTDAAKLNRALEVLAYSTKARYTAKVWALSETLAANLAAVDAKDKARVKRSFAVLMRNGILAKDEIPLMKALGL